MKKKNLENTHDLLPVPFGHFSVLSLLQRSPGFRCISIPGKDHHHSGLVSYTYNNNQIKDLWDWHIRLSLWRQYVIARVDVDGKFTEALLFLLSADRHHSTSSQSFIIQSRSVLQDSLFTNLKKIYSYKISTRYKLYWLINQLLKLMLNKFWDVSHFFTQT